MKVINQKYLNLCWQKFFFTNEMKLFPKITLNISSQKLIDLFDWCDIWHQGIFYSPSFDSKNLPTSHYEPLHCRIFSILIYTMYNLIVIQLIIDSIIEYAFVINESKLTIADHCRQLSVTFVSVVVRPHINEFLCYSYTLYTTWL